MGEINSVDLTIHSTLGDELPSIIFCDRQVVFGEAGPFQQLSSHRRSLHLNIAIVKRKQKRIKFIMSSELRKPHSLITASLSVAAA